MRIGAIDVGSNSIKLLVAEPGAEPEPIRTVEHRIEETRLGSHLSSGQAGLPPDLIREAIESIRKLADRANELGAERIVIVATSAVRDAANRDTFQHRLEAEIGLTIRIIEGAEEARLIALGLLQDPEMRRRDTIELADLGGGSLELVAYAHGKLEQAISLPLGAVRLMKQFIANPAEPIPQEALEKIRLHAIDTLRNSGFRFPKNHALIAGLGGAMTLVRELLAGLENQPVETFRQNITPDDLARLLREASGRNLGERRTMANMNPARADVIVPALSILAAILDFSDRPGFHQSNYNLRYGIAAELLATTGPSNSNSDAQNS